MLRRRIARDKIKIQSMQAKIDALMLEFCPDEMTAKQKDNWAKHQVPALRRSE